MNIYISLTHSYLHLISLCYIYIYKLSLLFFNVDFGDYKHTFRGGICLTRCRFVYSLKPNSKCIVDTVQTSCLDAMRFFFLRHKYMWSGFIMFCFVVTRILEKIIVMSKFMLKFQAAG